MANLLISAMGDVTQRFEKATESPDNVFVRHVIVDSGGGGGTEYTEDVALPAAPIGGSIVAERDDALTTITPAEADWAHLRVSAEGALWVQDFNSDGLLTDTNAMVVDLAALEVLLTTIDADTGAIKTAVEILDNAITGSEMQVDVVAALPTGANTIGDVTISGAALTALQLLDNAISGTEMQVDVVAALPAGTNAIGKLAANSGVDIGDVDVTSLPALAAGTNDVGVVGHNTTGLADGVKTVSTAGTDEALIGSTACKWAIIQAQTDNTGLVAVGATGVDATVATGTGILLAAGESVTIITDNLADIYVDSTVNGEGVRFVYGT